MIEVGGKLDRQAKSNSSRIALQITRDVAAIMDATKKRKKGSGVHNLNGHPWYSRNIVELH